MFNAFDNGGIFLIQTLFNLYMTAVLVRLLLQINRARFYDPVVQFIIQLTQKPLAFLRRLIPGYAGFDWASVVLLVVLALLKIFLIFSLIWHIWPSIFALLVLIVADLFTFVCQFYFYALLIQALLSWFTMGHSPISTLLYTLTEPLLNKARRMLPVINGLDLSPLPVMIGLQLLLIMVADPLNDYGRMLVGMSIFR